MAMATPSVATEPFLTLTIALPQQVSTAKPVPVASAVPTPVAVPTVVLDAGKKPKPTKKQKKKKDPNEPQKPVSAYALFFRDTQAAIKGQNPKATFGEVSKIVASMWDSLGEEQKQVRIERSERGVAGGNCKNVRSQPSGTGSTLGMERRECGD